TPFYGEILRKGFLTDYMNEYSDKHRSDILKKYPSFRSFENKFVVSDKDIADFLAYCASKGVKPKEGDMAISGAEIRRNFKGLIIRSVYSFSNFIEFLNKEDKEVLKAVEVLTKGE
ncbi:MAG: hypothetical protein IKA14_03100, partial [Bacteroidales bacterium]|nr:hypothetical protein [Bacteroidales bacterium]